MSDYIVTQHYNRNSIVLRMDLVGEDYETGSIKFKLEAMDGRPTLCESPFIPVKCLFDMAYLIETSLRLNGLRMEQEIVKIAKFNNRKEKRYGKKDKAK